MSDGNGSRVYVKYGDPLGRTVTRPEVDQRGTNLFRHTPNCGPMRAFLFDSGTGTGWTGGILT